MAKIALFTEIAGNELKSVTLEILSKLSGHHTDVVGIGDISPVAHQLKEYGAASITSITGGDTTNYSPEGYANLACALSQRW